MNTIRHTVTFRLKHERGSLDENLFLEAAGKLASLPFVRQFELLKEINPKNDFEFGISMEFESAGDYDAYNNHPDHVKFVRERWIPEVAEFIEIDFAL